MKIFNYIVSAAFGTLAMTSCTDLSEKLYDQVASENYYNTKNIPSRLLLPKLR